MARTSLLQSAVLLAAFLLCYCLALVVHRLYFHPLSKFPGPKIAAITRWYEFYYDVVHPNQYYLKIQEMHCKYGPIVRYVPDELHIQDLDFYDEVYASPNRKRDRPSSWGSSFHQSKAPALFTMNHDLHRRRRAALSPFFSKKAVGDLDGAVREKISKVLGRLETAAETHEVLRLEVAFTALATDIITQYAFEKSWNCLDQKDFNLAWKEIMVMSFSSNGMTRQFPVFLRMIALTPPWLIKILSPGMGYFLNWKAEVENDVKSTTEASASSADVKADDMALDKTMFQILHQSNLPTSEKTVERLNDEAIIVVGGAVETVQRNLTVATFHLLDNPSILSKLRTELRSIWPDPSTPADLPTLEHAPYLSAVISESLRLGGSTCLPSGRIAPSETLTYKGWVIPPGTAISQTNCMLLHDEQIFPDPLVFKPERWLTDATGKADKRKKPFFSTGARSCIGMNLGYAELYLTIAEVFRRFDFDLFETDRSDVDIAQYCMGGLVRMDSKGLCVKVAGRRDD